MLKLRRGRGRRRSSAGDARVDAAVGRSSTTASERAARDRVSGADRAGRGGRRGGRERRGAGPRPRQRRLRRRLRQPHARARGRGRAGRARDEAQLHAAPARGRAGRGGARASCPTALDLPVGGARPARPARAGGVRRSRARAGRARRLRPDRRRRAPRAAVRLGRGAARPRAARRPRHRRALLRRRARGDHARGRAARAAPSARLGRGSGRARARASSAPPRRSATAGWRRCTAPTPRWRSAATWCWRRGCRAATRASATAASATTRATVLELLLRPVDGRRCPTGIAAEARAQLERGARRGGHARVEVDVDDLARALPRERPAGRDDGPLDRRGRGLLPGGARRRAPRWREGSAEVA